MLGAFLLPRTGGEMRNIMKDLGTQSYIWSFFSSVLAWFLDHQNLMLLTMAIGVVTAVANAHKQCREGKMLERARERADELHKAEMEERRLRIERLKKGLGNEEFDDDR